MTTQADNALSLGQRTGDKTRILHAVKRAQMKANTHRKPYVVRTGYRGKVSVTPLSQYQVSESLQKFKILEICRPV